MLTPSISSVCVNCGTSYLAKTGRSKFCSKQCKSVYTRLHKFDGQEVICIQCGKTKKPTTPNQRFCSHSCNLSYTSTRLVKTLTCVDCQTQFEFVGRTKAKRCVTCRKKWGLVKSYRCAVKKGKIRKPGVGKGGNQFGANNHGWIGGRQFWKNKDYSKTYRAICFHYWPMQCSACGKRPADYEVMQDRLEVHHVDGSPSNCDPCNLIPLCHNCHINKLHRRKKQTKEELLESLKAIWPECQTKIAELSEKISKEKTRTELLDSNQEEGQRLEAETEKNIMLPRGRDNES